MELFSYLLFAVVGGVAFVQLYGGFMQVIKGEDEKLHCMTCGTDATPKFSPKGSFAVEVICWLCFIVPGLIYSVWRRASKPARCPACSATNVVPYAAPAAVAHRKAISG